MDRRRDRDPFDSKNPFKSDLTPNLTNNNNNNDDDDDDDEDDDDIGSSEEEWEDLDDRHAGSGRIDAAGSGGDLKMMLGAADAVANGGEDEEGEDDEDVRNSPVYQLDIKVCVLSYFSFDAREF